MKIQGVAGPEELFAQGMSEEKKKMARLLLERGADKKMAKAVSLLEDCVICGDDDALLMLAKCCAFGLGMERNVERAKTLITEAAKKGNQEGQSLMELLEECKDKDKIDLDGLPSHDSCFIFRLMLFCLQ